MNCLFLWLFDDWVLNQLSIEIPSELQLPKAFSWASFWKNESLSNGVKKFSKYLEKSSKPDILHSDYTATSFKVNDNSVHDQSFNWKAYWPQPGDKNVNCNRNKL